jgi:hypothetical protein
MTKLFKVVAKKVLEDEEQLYPTKSEAAKAMTDLRQQGYDSSMTEVEIVAGVPLKERYCRLFNRQQYASNQVITRSRSGLISAKKQLLKEERTLT